MKYRFLLAGAVLTLAMQTGLRADEGMWIPLLIEKYNIKLMQEKGFKLTAEDIYSVNKACMKDAVVHFGGGCTGEVISSDGLIITNHHCGYSQIQQHSSLEHDYLTDGFWAMSAAEELPNPGLTVTFLKRIEDVTQKVLEGITGNTGENERNAKISSNIDAIVREAVRGTGYAAAVRPFYMGNQYFLIVNEIFRDVRLVGAPPSAIGKFGGETDNWMWPRHTGDFSLFRIYAGQDNRPAEYSAGNTPYKPAWFFPISLRGIKEGDFTMVFGYPGVTYQYVPSFHIDMLRNYLNPKMIEIRTKKIEIMDEAMNSNPLVRIQYAAKKSGLANSWKRWTGENIGLDRMKTIDKKQQYEEKLAEWINADSERTGEYGTIFQRYAKLYESLREYIVINNCTNEIFRGADALTLAAAMQQFAEMIINREDPVQIEQVRQYMLNGSTEFYKNYNSGIDKKLFAAVMTLYGESIEPKWQIPEYVQIKNSCRGNFEALADRVFSKSVYTDEARFKAFLGKFNESHISKLEKDPLYLLASAAADYLDTKVTPELDRLFSEQQKLNTTYMSLQMKYETGRLFYPDANSTIRVAYGAVKGYFSKDAVYYTHLTTLKGIMEKDNPAVYDYDVPDRLKELYRLKDYGRYAHDGEIPVCFIASNHTTGGNSGSPVINADGHLIGVNFDRAWEGVASDMAFNPEQSRNISLDIRYALFIIDKFAGAGYLMNTMKIVE
ncbi:MAG: S46 family peptidase [Bacteroidales bacterium]|jgi:hypothetical protein|nr:S46 family peptidase [Bacteroidales bacterium]